MKKLILLSIISSAIVINFSACKKATTTPTTPTASASTPSNPTPTPSDASGYFAAIKTMSFVAVPGFGSQQVDIGVASAACWNVANTFLDGGAISVSGSALTKATNNAYAYTPAANNTSGISFSSGVNWSIAGNTGNGVPSFSYSPVKSFPTMSAMTAITKVTRASGATISSSATIANADSIIFTVYGPSGFAQFYQDGSSHTFTASELSSIGAGNGFVQICAYTIESYTTGGKKYYFIQESCTTNSVTID